MALSVMTSPWSPGKARLCQAVFLPPDANPVKPRFLTSKPVSAPESSRCAKSTLPRASTRQVPAKRGSDKVSGRRPRALR